MSESTSTHSPSLREALNASWDAHGGDTGSPAAEAPAPAAGDAASSPTDGATAAQSGDRPRDASGRFAPASGQPGEAQARAPADADMPDGYDPAVWGMLSPEARAQTAAWAGKQRETVAERDARLKGYEPIDRVLSQQRRDALSMQYGGVDRALEQLFALSDFAARDPGGFVRHFAQQRGVNLSQLMQQPTQGAQGQPQQEMSPQQAIQAMVAQEIERRDVDRLYNEFAGQADLEHRNDPQVRTTMAALLAANQAKDYAQAYQMAVRAHPDFGPKLLAAQAAEQAKGQQAVAAETARARASAAASLSGAPGTTRPAGNAAPASIRDALDRAWNSAGGARV